MGEQEHNTVQKRAGYIQPGRDGGKRSVRAQQDIVSKDIHVHFPGVGQVSAPLLFNDHRSGIGDGSAAGPYSLDAATAAAAEGGAALLFGAAGVPPSVRASLESASKVITGRAACGVRAWAVAVPGPISGDECVRACWSVCSRSQHLGGARAHRRQAASRATG